MTSDEIARSVIWCKDQFERDHPGFCEPAEADWEEVAEYPLAKLGDPAQWREWFAEEVRMRAEDGDENYFDDMMTDPILCPIVVLERDGVAYIWDGNHRVGASFARGLTHTPAIVGRPRPAQALKPQGSTRLRV